jgi:toxin ParE1/3/4
MPVLKIEFHPDALSELQLSRDWYEEKATNLGTDFFDEIERALKVIEEAPTVWPLYNKEQGTRRFLVHRFPYAILCRTTSTSIQVLPVMHLRRHPDYWKSRIAPS